MTRRDGERGFRVCEPANHSASVGGNHAFERIYGMDVEYTLDSSGGRLPEEVAEFVGPGWIWKETPAELSRASYRSRPLPVTDYVEDGQVRPLFDSGARSAALVVDRSSGRLAPTLH